MLFTSPFTEKKVSPEVSFGGMLFGNAGLVDFTSWQGNPDENFADPIRTALYDSGPCPLVVSSELWARSSFARRLPAER